MCTYLFKIENPAVQPCILASGSNKFWLFRLKIPHEIAKFGNTATVQKILHGQLVHEKSVFLSKEYFKTFNIKCTSFPKCTFLIETGFFSKT